jgi:predicted HD phosphohydrolase
MESGTAVGEFILIYFACKFSQSLKSHSITRIPVHTGMDGCGVVDHEHVGAAFLAALGFPTRIQDMVRNHISAKRYLCCAQPDYYDKLSEASKVTLRYVHVLGDLLL